MAKFTDTSLMPFGKHKGQRLMDVPPGYLLWLHDNGLQDGPLKDYIIDNIGVLRHQRDKEKIRTSSNE